MRKKEALVTPIANISVVASCRVIVVILRRRKNEPQEEGAGSQDQRNCDHLVRCREASGVDETIVGPSAHEGANFLLVACHPAIFRSHAHVSQDCTRRIVVTARQTRGEHRPNGFAGIPTKIKRGTIVNRRGRLGMIYLANRSRELNPTTSVRALIRLRLINQMELCVGPS